MVKRHTLPPDLRRSIDDSAYRAAHGAAPSGYREGGWQFRIDGGTVVGFWSRYDRARKSLMAWCRHYNVLGVVEVLP